MRRVIWRKRGSFRSRCWQQCGDAHRSPATNRQLWRPITLDGFEPSHAALRRMGMRNEFNFRLENPVKIRSCAYLNNIVEQDHRRIKARFSRCSASRRFTMHGASLSASSSCRSSTKVNMISPVRGDRRCNRAPSVHVRRYAVELCATCQQDLVYTCTSDTK
jgi:hypothetical protein